MNNSNEQNIKPNPVPTWMALIAAVFGGLGIALLANKSDDASRIRDRDGKLAANGIVASGAHAADELCSHCITWAAGQLANFIYGVNPYREQQKLSESRNKPVIPDSEIYTDPDKMPPEHLLPRTFVGKQTLNWGNPYKSITLKIG